MVVSDSVGQYTEHKSPHVRNRATIVLMTLEGKDRADIAATVGLSESTVQKWQSAWESDGMGIFPALETATGPVEGATAAIGDQSANEAVGQADAPEEWAGEQQGPLHGLVFPETPPFRSTSAMAEAGRKIMLQLLQQMLAYEPVARDGKDIEGVHQMRVVTRRWRSAYDTFGDYLPKSYSKRLYKDVRRTARRLGDVRDLDVFLHKTRTYVKANLDGDNTELQPLLKAIKKDRREARKRLARWLDDESYRLFVQRAFNLLTQATDSKTLIVASGEIRSTRLDHLLPDMIYRRLRAVRRYEEVLPDAPITILHELRIDLKRLRYILEFFVDILGEPVRIVIERTKAQQDHLGDLNDAQIAMDIIRATEKQVKKTERAALKAYRKYRQAEMLKLRDTFPETWAQFSQPEVRRALAEAMGVL